MASTAQAEQRRIVLGAAIGMTAVFVVIAVLVRASGQPWSTAAGVAGLPTMFGGWYFGALLPLSRHDLSDEPSTSAARAAAISTDSPNATDADPSVADAPSVEDNGVEPDAVAPAA